MPACDSTSDLLAVWGHGAIYVYFHRFDEQAGDAGRFSVPVFFVPAVLVYGYLALQRFVSVAASSDAETKASAAALLVLQRFASAAASSNEKMLASAAAVLVSQHSVAAAASSDVEKQAWAAALLV